MTTHLHESMQNIRILAQIRVFNHPYLYDNNKNKNNKNNNNENNNNNNNNDETNSNPP